MLQNEPPGTRGDARSDDAQGAGVPALPRQATPQELSRALASWGARKEEAARRQEELSRGPGPDQIWAEVLALRAQEDAASARGMTAPRFPSLPPSFPPPATDPRRADRQKKTLLFVAVACAAFALAGWLRPSPAPRVSSHSPPALVPARVAPSMRGGFFDVAAPDAEFYRKLNRSQGPHPQYRILLRSAWEMPPSDGRPPDATVYSLSAVPDGCTFYRQPPVGVGFGSSGPFGPSCVFEEAGAGAATPGGMMTRYEGRFYFRTWIRRDDIARLKRGDALDLYPSPAAPEPGRMVPLTLPVGLYATCADTAARPRPLPGPCFQSLPFDLVLGLPQGVKAALDGHAWEDFPAFPQRTYRPPAWDKEPGFFVPDRSQGFGTRGFDASSQVEPLGSVPDGTPIHCSSVTLNQMLHPGPSLGTVPQPSVGAGPPPPVLVDARPQLDRPWTVIKFGGRPYLRGWIADRPARPLPAGRDLAVFSGARAPEFVNPPVRITLPLDPLVWHRTEDGASPTVDAAGTVGRVIVADVRLDGHAWDKW